MGCGQNCAATRAYCGHAQTEKLKTTASTAGRGHAPAVPDRDVVLPDDLVAGDHLEAVRLQPADELLAEPPVDRLERTLKEMPAVAEVEDADAGFTGLEMLEHGDAVELSEVTETTKNTNFKTRSNGETKTRRKKN